MIDDPLKINKTKIESNLNQTGFTRPKFSRHECETENRKPKPKIRNRNRKSETENPKPKPKPKIQNRKPKTETENPKTRKPKTENWNRKSENRKPKPKTEHSKPKTIIIAEEEPNCSLDANQQLKKIKQREHKRSWVQTPALYPGWM